MLERIAQYTKELQKIYGQHLKKVILYGSYARGDFNKDSDVDIMILVDLPDDALDEFSDSLAEVGFEYNVAYDIWMMPVVKNIDHFHHWCKVYPFYANVQNEGVSLYDDMKDTCSYQCVITALQAGSGDDEHCDSVYFVGGPVPGDQFAGEAVYEWK